nr:MAG TPA: hypothetical protein [Caudoviricetes sp.]
MQRMDLQTSILRRSAECTCCRMASAGYKSTPCLRLPPTCVRGTKTGVKFAQSFIGWAFLCVRRK